MSFQSDQERDRLLSEATAATRQAIPTAESDPSRPTFHFVPPAQWMNDPNGPVYVDGWFHLFYQFNPYGDQWGHMHWGHARSKDLVNWEYLPIALWPSKAEGEDHVYSGSTFLNGKTPQIYYTSIGDKREPQQWMAKPIDSSLIVWEKSSANPVVSIGKNGPANVAEWRDPFLFHEGKSVYLITGGGIDGHGTVLLYRAENKDLTDWKYVGVLFTHPDADVHNIECPNLARLGNRWVLLVSVHGRVESFVGRLNLAAHAFTAENRGVLNEGSYASQLVTDPSGRVIHWAWIPTSNHKGWNGCMTLPSVLKLGKDGALLREPISSLSSLRKESAHIKDQTFSGSLSLTGQLADGALEVVLDVDPQTAAKVSLHLRNFTLTYEPGTRKWSAMGRGGILQSTALKLHLFLDRSIVDMYADGGAVTESFSFDYDPSGPLAIEAEGGSANIRSLQVFSLRGATFDLSRF